MSQATHLSRMHPAGQMHPTGASSDRSKIIMADELIIADRQFGSRLILGTGKYDTMDLMVRALETSGTEMVTVAIRRVNLENRTSGSLLDYIDTERYHLLPNTAGCYSAEEAIRTSMMAREVLDTNWVKLEVI